MGYFVVQGAKSRTDMGDAVSFLMDLHWGQDQKVDERLTRFGIMDKDPVGQRRMEKILARYDAICSQARRARIQAINMQERIRRSDDFLGQFGEERGAKYIDVLEFRRER